MSVKTWAPKDPDDVDYRWVSWANWLDEAETITASEFILVSGSVVLDSDSLATPVATLWLSGGTEGETCEITNRVTTSAGRVKDQQLRIRVIGRDD